MDNLGGWFGSLNTGNAKGANGVATANASSNHPICGVIAAVYVNYNGSPPATTDVIIKTVGTFPAPPSFTILTLTNNNTSGKYHPNAPICDTNGAPLTFDGSNVVPTHIPIDDYVNAAIQQANANQSADVWLFIEPEEE